MKKYLNRSKKGSFWILTLIFIVLFSSCDDFVEVDLPSHLLTGETVFEDVQTAEAALGDIYARLRDEVLLTGTPQGISVLMGVYTDELEYFGGSAQEAFFFNNSLVPGNESIATFWNGCYNLIYGVNAVLEGLENSSQIDETDKLRLRGEALFLRAFIHSYLTGIFGEIPYVTQTDYDVNTTIDKLSVSEVYDKCIGDALEAKMLLPMDDVTGERLKPNQMVAGSLLARLYLQSGQWENAVNASSEVIGATSWESDITQVFLKESSATIWQLYPFAEGMNTLEAQSFVFVAGPPPGRALSPQQMQAFEPGDERRVHWVGTVTDGVQEWYHANKYKIYTPTPTSVEYSKVFRLAEMHLIRAEANARIGNLSNVPTDLNILRTRAGLPPVSVQTQEAMLEAVFQERQVEFFTEFGHRFFDLKRSGKINEVLGIAKPGWGSHNNLWPIPEQELLTNPNLLPQNPGY